MTAKLSQKFYERLGEEIANELVDWFNQVDATYRNNLRELNELNFARFDAKLEQRAAELNATIDRVAAQLDAKIDRVAAELDAKINQVAAEIRQEMHVGFSKIDARLSEWKAEVVRTMFLFWTGTTLTIIGVMIALLKL